MVHSPREGDREKLLAHAQQAREVLGRLVDVTSVEVHDAKLAEVVERIRTLIAESQSSVSRELVAFESQSSWDELVVAFFGETNAGKSTLIEALSATSGSTIGDGTKDFTRAVREQRLDLGAGAPVTLLDMPGVEGHEEDVLVEIDRAITRAHVIVVVIGNEKEPERGLVERIRRYLSLRATVLVVINARGAARASMPAIESAALRVVAERTAAILRQALGDFFQDTVIVNARIAFLAAAPAVTDRFARDAEKQERAFASRAHALAHSGLHRLQARLRVLASSAQERTIVANGLKLLSVVQRTTGQLLREKKRFDALTGRAATEVEHARDNLRSALAEAGREADRQVEVSMAGLRVTLAQTVHDAIDAGFDEATAARSLDANVRDANRELQARLDSVAKELEAKVSAELERFKTRLRIEVGAAGPDGAVDLSKVLAELETGVKYVMKELGGVIVALLGALSTLIVAPLLGIAVAVVSILSKIYDWFVGQPADRKRRAKATADETIDAKLRHASTKVHSAVRRQFDNVEHRLDLQIGQISKLIEGLRKLSRRIDQQLAELVHLDGAIATHVVERVAGPSVTAAYVDLGLRAACVVGARLSRPQARMLNQRRYVCASSFGDLMERRGFVRQGAWLIASRAADEVVVRTLKAHVRRAGLRGVRRSAR